MVGVIMVVFDPACVLFAIDREDDPGNGSFGVKSFSQVIISQCKTGRLPGGIAAVRSRSKFELFCFTVVGEVDGYFGCVNRNCGFRSTVQHIDSDLAAVAMHDFRVVVFIAEFHEVPVMRAFVGMRVVMIVSCRKRRRDRSVSGRASSGCVRTIATSSQNQEAAHDDDGSSGEPMQGNLLRTRHLWTFQTGVIRLIRIDSSFRHSRFP